MKSLTRDKEISPEFNAFWAAYPKRKSRLDAWKAWQKLRPTPEVVAQIMAALVWQTQQDDWLKAGGQFVPFPATWLRAERWTDEPSATPEISNSTLRMARATQEFLQS